MRKMTELLAASVLLATISTCPLAQQLPKSGTISIHSGWKAVGETVQPAEGRIYGTGIFWGVTFNDKGDGPLHKGYAMCPYNLEIITEP